MRGEEDGGTERGAADGVERDGKSGKTLREKGSCDMEDRDHKKDESKAESRRESGPVGGHKESDASREENPAKEKSDEYGPAKRGTMLLRGFESENAVGGSGIDDASSQPSLHAGGELGALGHEGRSEGERYSEVAGNATGEQ